MSGGGAPSPTYATQASINPTFQPYATAASNFLTNQVGTSQTPWPGPFAAPPTQQQNFGADYMQALGQEAASSVLSPTSLNAMTALAGGQYLPAANPYIQQIMQGMQQLSNTQLDRQISQLQAQYGAQGASMNSLGAQGIADLETNTNASLQQQLGQLGLNALSIEQPLQMEAAQSGLNYEPSIAQANEQIGSQYQGINQQALQAMMQEYQRIQQSPYIPLNYLPGVTPTSAAYPQYPASSTASIGGALASLLTTPLTGTLLGSFLG